VRDFDRQQNNQHPFLIFEHLDAKTTFRAAVLWRGGLTTIYNIVSCIQCLTDFENHERVQTVMLEVLITARKPGSNQRK
jgi:hypothetical protein